MSFLKKIGKFIDSPIGGFATGGIGGIIQGMGDYKSAQKQMKFQSQMSNTAVQRQMADMRKAGINPILAAKYGGASTPSGASYSLPNIGAAAVEGYKSASSAKQMRSQAKVSEEQAKNLMQDREIKKVLHDERWPRLFSTMSPENVLSSVLATINDIDIEQTLKGIKGKPEDIANLYQFLREVQANKSKLAQETYGIGRLLGDALNTVSGRVKESARMSRYKSDFFIDALKAKREIK